MSLPPDTSQGIANALRYLQYHLHKLIERQNVSENNINTILVALTTLKGAKETISLAQAKDAVPGPNCMLKSLWR